MASGLGDTKYEFGRHLSHLGYELGKPRDRVVAELRRHMGDQRFAEYQRVAAAAKDTAEGQDAVYDFVQNMREANLLRSACLDATLDTSYYMYEKCLPRLTSGARVIELACWTGGLASFIAEKHPDCTVVGVDRAKRIIQVDREYFNLPNLSFAEWDYRKPKPDHLEPADALLCGLGVDNSVGPNDKCDPAAVRQSECYQRERADAMTYLENWRGAAKNGALLVGVLRVFTFPRFLGFIDAAQKTGWSPLLDDFTIVQILSNKERIPSLVFKAEHTKWLSEDVVLSHWIRIISGNHQVADLTGPVALGMYRALANKQVLTHRESRGKGGQVREELGISGCFGYIFVHDARPEYRLVLTTIEKVKAAARGPSPSEKKLLQPNVVTVVGNLAVGDVRMTLAPV